MLTTRYCLRFPAYLWKVQNKCIAALEVPLATYKAGEALVSNSTYQRHRANLLEQRLHNALAELAHVTAESEANRANPTLEGLVNRLQAELLGANQAVERLEEELREQRAALHKSSEDVRNAQLELATLKGSPQKASEPSDDGLKEMQALRELVFGKDRSIAEKDQQISQLQSELSRLQSEVDELKKSSEIAQARVSAKFNGSEDAAPLEGFLHGRDYPSHRI